MFAQTRRQWAQMVSQLFSGKIGRKQARAAFKRQYEFIPKSIRVLSKREHLEDMERQAEKAARVA